MVSDLGRIYGGLDDLAVLSPLLQEAAWRGIGRTPADLATVDYDVTNYFFHIDAPDQDPVGKDGARGQATRQKGYSKEHRPDPIIQMGLFLDAEGIPVSYRLFDGNVPDMSTLTSALSEFKTVFRPGRIVVVADKGLNTAPNLIGLHDHGDGWIVAASHRRDRAVQDWILDPTGWVWNPEGTFRIKSQIIEHTISARVGGVSVKAVVKEKFVAAWSTAAATRDRATREELLRKADLLAADAPTWRAGNKRGPRKYVTENTVDTTTGEILTGHDTTILGVDRVRAAAEALLDGYHMVRTSETTLGDQHILDRYHQLWQIEHAFRVSKTDLEARPVFVRLPSRIEGHFAICFLALLATRLLERWTGLPSAQLVQAIKDFQAMPCGDGVYRLQRPGWEPIDAATGVALNQTWATIDQIRNWARQLTAAVKTTTFPTRHNH